MKQYKDVVELVNHTLQRLLIGKTCQPISTDDFEVSEELAQLVELLNILTGNLNELNEFARHLAKGNLDVPIPGRRNYLAATLKELHAQLLSYIWSVNQLQKGGVVERMDFTGELSNALNSLISLITDLSMENPSLDISQSTAVSSWQYHQILTALNHLHMMVVESESDGKVIFLNIHAKNILGNVECLADSHASCKFGSVMACLSANCMPTGQFPITQEVYNGPTGHWYRITTDQISFPDGRAIYLHTLEDISEWKTSTEKLYISATVDQLTGVYNRSYGISELENILNKRGDYTHCVAFIDIDNLKGINDTYGHPEGDYAISTIASVLSSAVRVSDFISRLGGDEFLIVFRNCKTGEAEQAISRMIEKLESINEIHNKPYNLGFSHGLVQISTDSDITANETIMLADKKMYERKTLKKLARAKAHETTISSIP